jgi:hypothetical protein
MQAALGIMIVGFFLVVSAALLLVPLFGGLPPEGFSAALDKYVSVSSGIVGMVVGFFFGRKSGGASD